MNRIGWVGLVVVLGVTGVTLAGAETDEALRATMRGVHDRLAALLPLAASHEPLDESEREEFGRRLADLREVASKLDGHGASRDAGFRYLASTLEDDLAAPELRWQYGEESSARYAVLDATSNCVACHSRLPQGTAPSIASSFEQHFASDSTTAQERAQLLVATRQFDRALTAWESVLRDPEIPPAEIDVGGYLLDYLTIALRVVGDLERPLPVLRALAARESTPRYFRRYLEQWIAELEDLATRPVPSDRLAAARALEQESRHGSGRERMVVDLQTSAWLLQAIEQDELSPPQQAEAFYLLGLVESRNVEGYWVPQTDAHLEAAVRLDPGGPHAGHAYDLLEEWLITGYAGFDGNELPEALENRLRSLLTLMEAEYVPPKSESSEAD